MHVFFGKIEELLHQNGSGIMSINVGGRLYSGDYNLMMKSLEVAFKGESPIGQEILYWADNTGWAMEAFIPSTQYAGPLIPPEGIDMDADELLRYLLDPEDA